MNNADRREQERLATRRNKVTTQTRIFIIALNWALLITLAVAPLTGQNVQTKSNPKQNISKLGKYSWKNNKMGFSQTPEVMAEMDRTIKDAVNSELAKRGYVESSQDPDFLVQVSAFGIPEMATSANTDLTNPFNAMVYTQVGGPGVNIWMAVVSNLSFILTDRSSNEVAWQADVTKKYKDPQKAIRNLKQEVQSVVKKSLKDLPRHK
jgi:hypothetical protein